jgi:hypothetical protein
VHRFHSTKICPHLLQQTPPTHLKGISPDPSTTTSLLHCSPRARGDIKGTFFQKIILTRCGCAAGCARNEPTGMPLKYAIKKQGCLKLLENQSGMARSAIPEFEGAC